MKDSSAFTIFHIYRKDGIPLFLHPFQNPSFFSELNTRLENGELPVINGRFGREPRVESLTLFRNELYRLIEQSVNLWMAEKRFIPRFLFSAAVFLIAYFFASVVIRDPIPMVDELVIGLGAAVAAYLLVGKQLKNSDMATKKRIQLREVVDRIVFTESPFLKVLENLLEKNEQSSPQELLENLWSEESPFAGSDESSAEKDKDEMGELVAYLEKQFDRDIVRWHEKSVSSGRKQDADRESEKIRRMKKLDLPLFSTYTKLKEFCRK